jgi:hypothetical protein
VRKCRLALGCGRVDDGLDRSDGVGGEAGVGRVVPDQLFAGRDVDAEEFVGGDVGLDPLDLGPRFLSTEQEVCDAALSCSGVRLPTSGVLRSMRNFGISIPLQ